MCIFISKTELIQSYRNINTFFINNYNSIKNIQLNIYYSILTQHCLFWNTHRINYLLINCRPYQLIKQTPLQLLLWKTSKICYFKSIYQTYNKSLRIKNKSSLFSQFTFSDSLPSINRPTTRTDRPNCANTEGIEWHSTIYTSCSIPIAIARE